MVRQLCGERLMLRDRLLYSKNQGPGLTPEARPWWRVRVTATQQGSYASLADLQFRGSIGGTQQAVGGTAIESSHFSAFVAANAFDVFETSTRWESGGGAIGAGTAEYIGYHFVADVDVAEIGIISGNSAGDVASQAPTNFMVQSSPDGTTWTDCWEVVGLSPWGVSELRTFVNPLALPPTALVATGGVVTYDDLYEVHTFAPDVAPGVSIKSDEYSSGYLAAFAFDNNAGTIWTGSGSIPAWIGFHFTNAVDVGEILIRARSDASGYQPSAFSIQYSDDGSSWTTAWSESGQTSWAVGTTRVFANAGPFGSHAYWRVYVTANEAGSYPGLAELQFRATVGGVDQTQIQSQSLVVTTPGLAECLMVAGGAAGGDGQDRTGGGAGGGGVLHTTLYFPVGTFPVAVGIGGTVVGQVGSNGVDTTFSGRVAKGGGHGDGYVSGAAVHGGSGGGSRHGAGGATGTPPQGHDGGTLGDVVGGGSGSYMASGGGGAATPGASASTSGDGKAGDGGDGVLISITGTPTYYGGGGGGGEANYGTGTPAGRGLGGDGGGGDGGKAGAGVADHGAPGTDGLGGGGGGGGRAGSHGGVGGFGTVIVRFLS